MASDQEYQMWSETHRKAFGFNFQDDIDMLEAWYPSLKGFSLAELMDASDTLIRSPEPMNRDKHRAVLMQVLHKNRAIMKEPEEPTPGNYSWCDNCRNGGLVSVPYPDERSLAGGIWRPIGPSAIYYTAGVICSCPIGQRKYRSFAGEDRSPMTLEQYQDGCLPLWSGNPNWREQIEERRDQQRAERKLDKTSFGKLIQKRIAELVDRAEKEESNCV